MRFVSTAAGWVKWKGKKSWSCWTLGVTRTMGPNAVFRTRTRTTRSRTRGRTSVLAWITTHEYRCLSFYSSLWRIYIERGFAEYNYHCSSYSRGITWWCLGRESTRLNLSRWRKYLLMNNFILMLFAYRVKARFRQSKDKRRWVWVGMWRVAKPATESPCASKPCSCTHIPKAHEPRV